MAVEDLPWGDDEEMYARLDPIIRSVARIFRKAPNAVGAEAIGQDDLVSHIWLELLRDDRRLLRGWRSERGTIEAYTYKVALSKARDVVRLANRRRRLAPTTQDGSVDGATGQPSPEDQAIGRHDGAKVDDCVRGKLTGGLALDVYVHGLLEGKEDDELIDLLQADRSRIYRLRYTARRALEQCVSELEGGDSSPKGRRRGED